MFTGIVEEVGRVEGVQARAGGATLHIAARRALEGMRVGDSISLNGVCMTITALSQRTFTTDAMPETLRRSNLSLLRAGDSVNLERPLRPESWLGGHFVQGHVDGMATLASLTPQGEALLARYEAPPELMRYIVPKGFVAVDGVSLTVVDCDRRSFSVSLVKHTQENTILVRKGPGYLANVEVDILGKYIGHLLSWRAEGEGLKGERLAEEGFLMPSLWLKRGS